MKKQKKSRGEEVAEDWFRFRKWKPFHFQREMWQAYLNGHSGVLNAPTGSGKTYAAFFGPLIHYINKNTDFSDKKPGHLVLLWITPLRALANDLRNAMQAVFDDLFIPWTVAVRTGDTPEKEKQQLRKQMPEVLITTPESLHLLLSAKDYKKNFQKLDCFVADEWHELMGSKRGVQVELALSHLKYLCPSLRVWGISATIGNMDEALAVLAGNEAPAKNYKMIRADVDKQVEIQTLIPEEVEKYPWSGHLGIRMIPAVLPIIKNSRSTLIFTNTRSHAETWYQQLLDAAPELAGLLAMHHGSLDMGLRQWVEQALHSEKLKAVICTSSLDLGVDFQPVDTVVQVGSPKGVARFIQRAGRSGHQPGGISRIWFLPTHSLELAEAAALKAAIAAQRIEFREPFYKPYDVLLQYIITMALPGGVDPKQLFHEVKNTYAYRDLTEDEWEQLVGFLITGGKSLGSYDEYKKLALEDGLLKVTSRKIAMQHRMNIGTIVSDSALRVKFLGGASLGTIEENFIARLKPGDIFWFAGRALEFVMLKDLTVLVRKSSSNKGIVPGWQGSRMPLSSRLCEMLRLQFDDYLKGKADSVEMIALQPLLERQQKQSAIPGLGEILVEKLKTREGYHVFIYPFEGRLVHEILGALTGYRLSQIKPLSFSIAMNDYGFELLSDQPFPVEEALEQGLFSSENLLSDIRKAINSTEMARRKFREIARVAGLIFQGYPGREKKSRHLQASSALIFNVFMDHDPQNLLIEQAFTETFNKQVEEERLRETLHRIHQQKITIKELKKPSPFAFPIVVDRLREKLSSESLAERVKKMRLKLEK